MAVAAEKVQGTSSREEVLEDQHGFILRAGLDALDALSTIRESGCKAVLHGSMVEVSIFSMTNQTVCDLLDGNAHCYIKDYHLKGATQQPLETAADVVNLAAAVETRLVRGTKMNDTSSRSHCIAAYTLMVVDEAGNLRTSRIQFFDREWTSEGRTASSRTTTRSPTCLLA